MNHFYLHIPFCRQRCPYCKFALTPVFDEFKKKRYIAHLKQEIQEYFSKITTLKDTKNISTIYFGGGTPSVLTHGEIHDILECFPFYRDSHTEITMEMNPEDITTEYIQGVLELGIHRISLGIQTLNETSLKEIHRSNRETIVGALERISMAIKESHRDISLNIDFILGLPYVRPEETLTNIKELHSRFPTISHTSIYMLEDERYPKHWKANSIAETEMQNEFLGIMQYLASIGWHHYELSNWARPGYESVHNQAYWDHSETRGFGLSAASYVGGVRWSNTSSFAGYYRGDREDIEILTPEQIQMEEMMFGLRRDGWIQEKKSAKLDILIVDGLLKMYKNKIKPTKTGIFVIDHILSELV